MTLSFQNCYRIGINDDIKISTINPLDIYINYANENINYYAEFIVFNKEQRILIQTIPKKYNTTKEIMKV